VIYRCAPCALRYARRGEKMVNNYLKIALRNIKRHKGYSFINIFGLAIGMAACILILLWVQDELSYDRFHKNSDHLYRVFAEFTYANENWAVTPIPLAPVLKDEFPEIVDAVRFRPYSTLIGKDEKKFNERGAYVDPSFLTTFDFPLKDGAAKTAFTDPFSIIITEAMAEKYFGEENPIGKTLKINNEFDCKIAGVLRNIPRNSHIRFDFLLPFDIFLKKDRDLDNWERFHLATYVQLHENVQINEIEAKITGLLNEHNPENDINLHLQPLTRIHLYNLNGGGSIEYVYIFSAIAIFILLIACINFMNLTTARSSTRIKEIGVRKVTGAVKGDFVRQFMGESILLSLVSFIIAINIVYLILPTFNHIAGKMLSLNLTENTNLNFGLLGILFFTSILAGSYPTFYLSAFKPIAILKGSSLPIFKKDSSASLRKSLVVLQFSISIFLIIATFVISQQLHFIQNKNLGFESEQVLYLPMKGHINQNYEAMKNEILRDKNILQVAATSGMLVDYISSYNGFAWEGKTPDKQLSMVLGSVDQDYIQTLKMEMAEGRSFSRDYPSDATSGFIVNESAVKAMGIESPIGKRFAFEGRNGWREGTIIGVVKDFHFQSLHSEIEPFVMIVEPDRFNYLCLSIKADYADLSQTLSFIENTWKKFAPGYPFEYIFLDQEFEGMYRSEQQTRKIFSYFTFLAIFISCLGLFGLASFTIERRTKEIGIRKVLGASVPGIVRLLSKEFIILVAISNLIAWPLAYYGTKKWLQNFAYHIDLSWLFFAISGLLALLIAIIVVGFQSLKVAFTNPVESLRYE
jgi:putative ABC transport system permease protein